MSCPLAAGTIRGQGTYDAILAACIDRPLRRVEHAIQMVQLVLQAGAMGKSGEVFMLDMGQPVKIVDAWCGIMGHAQAIRLDPRGGFLEGGAVGLDRLLQQPGREVATEGGRDPQLDTPTFILLVNQIPDELVAPWSQLLVDLTRWATRNDIYTIKDDGALANKALYYYAQIPPNRATSGADGLASEALAKAWKRLSLGPMTLPHGLARIVLAEQIYRAQSILAGHPYHRT